MIAELGCWKTCSWCCARDGRRPDVVFAGEPTPLTGGFWAQLVVVPPRRRARRMGRSPRGPGDAGPGDRAKETAFQRRRRRPGLPDAACARGRRPRGRHRRAGVPRHGPRRGQPLLAGLDGVAAIRRLPSLARRLPRALARGLAELHRLDPEPVITALDADGAPQPTLPTMLATLRHQRGSAGPGRPRRLPSTGSSATTP